MTAAYRIATVFVLALLGLSLAGSYWGWGLPDDASIRAQSVRQGSLHGRRYLGGGPGMGK